MDEQTIELLKKLVQQLESNSAALSEDPSSERMFGQSAARYNEAMAQAAADKQMAFIERQQDRWQLTLNQLRNVPTSTTGEIK